MKIRILIEYSEGVYSATAFDEVGRVAQRNSTKDKQTAIRRVKDAVEEQFTDEKITYTEEVMSSGEKD